MTEEKWLSEAQPFPLADYLRRTYQLNRTKAGRRKFWLFACGCCRRVWDRFRTEPLAAAVVVAAERFADGEVSFKEVQTRDEQLSLSHDESEPTIRLAAHALVYTNAFVVATATAEQCAQARSRELVFPSEATRVWSHEHAQAAHLLRCVFGNPFRLASFVPNPAWRTSTVIALAQGIYDERAFDRMPILADALQDAGCDNDDVLNHCRVDAVHARGCWVVDSVLGKS